MACFEITLDERYSPWHRKRKARFWQARLLGPGDHGAAERVLAAMNVTPDQRFPDGPKDPKAPLRRIVAYLAMTPDFQLR